AQIMRAGEMRKPVAKSGKQHKEFLLIYRASTKHPCGERLYLTYYFSAPSPTGLFTNRRRLGILLELPIPSGIAVHDPIRHSADSVWITCWQRVDPLLKRMGNDWHEEHAPRSPYLRAQRFASLALAGYSTTARVGRGQLAAWR